MNFQKRVKHWMEKAFGPWAWKNRQEREDRLFEEVVELMQARSVPKWRLLGMINRVYRRPPGEVRGELGAVMVGLAALAETQTLEVTECAESELLRIEQDMDKIVARQAGKPRDDELKALAHIDWIEWAAAKWRSEVQNRPLCNVHRAALDGAYRSVITQAGGDPEVLLGADHWTLCEAHPEEAAKHAPGAPAGVGQSAPSPMRHRVTIELHVDSAGEAFNYPEFEGRLVTHIMTTFGDDRVKLCKAGARG